MVRDRPIPAAAREGLRQLRQRARSGARPGERNALSSALRARCLS